MTSIQALLPLIVKHFSRERFPQTRFVYFIGPTCVGKGYLMRLLMRLFKILIALDAIKVGVISFGDIVKDLLETDPEFNRQFGPMVKNGDLIPDRAAIALFERAVDRMARNGMPNLVLVDGFCRSPDQIKFAAENGYLSKGDQVFMLEANEEVCLERFMHRCSAKPDGKERIDNELPTFNKRYDLHAATRPKLREMFKEVDCICIDINANKGIADVVFPHIHDDYLQETILEAARSERYLPTETLTR